MAIALLCPSFGHAETRNSHTLSTIVVTAHKEDATFQTGDVDIEETPSFYSFITRDKFEGKIESLGEVLQKEVGIQIRQSGGLGSFSTVSLRGASSEQVMVFLDGILLNDAAMGGVDLGNISLSDVEAIEVYRGSTPMNFGKASIGGVVNIRTLRSRKEPVGRLTAGYGSFNTRQMSAFINDKPGRWDYLVSADYLGSDNDFWILNDRGTDYNPYDDEWQRRKHNGFDQKNLLTKLGCALTDALHLDFSNQCFAKDQQIANWINLDGNASLDTVRNSTIAKLTADAVGPFNLSGYLDYTWKKEIYDDRQGDIGLGSQWNEYLTQTYGGHLFMQWVSPRQIANMMVDVRHETYAPKDLLYTERNPLDSHRTTYTVGAQDTLYLFDARLSLTPAVRYFHVDDLLQSGESYWGIYLEGSANHKDYINPQMGLKYRVCDWLTLKSNLAKYTREPSFFELFGDRGLFLGNEDLVAEEGVNGDIGLLISREPDHCLLNRVSLEVAWFKSEVDNLITRTYDARGVGKSVNVEGATIQGIESQLSLDFFDMFRLSANATWQDTTNNDRTEEFYGQQLAGRYEKAFTGRIEACYAGVRVYAEYLYESGMYYDTACTRKSPDKKIINAGLAWVLGHYRFQLEGKNLDNHRHEDFNGYYMPGRSYYGSVSYHF